VWGDRLVQVVQMGLFDGLFGGGYDPAREQQKEEDFR
jgi:hypothetical protein